MEASKEEKEQGVLIDYNLKPLAQCAKAKANMVFGQVVHGGFQRT